MRGKSEHCRLGHTHRGSLCKGVLLDLWRVQKDQALSFWKKETELCSLKIKWKSACEIEGSADEGAYHTSPTALSLSPETTGGRREPTLKSLQALGDKHAPSPTHLHHVHTN